MERKTTNDKNNIIENNALIISISISDSGIFINLILLYRNIRGTFNLGR